MTAPPAAQSHAGGRQEYSNFDYIRLIAAGCVLLSHGISIAQGHDRNDPMVWLFGQDITLGSYSVCVFFLISGFLVTRSACEGRRLHSFLLSRVLRIYPGLFICQLLTGLVIGGLFTRLDFSSYLRAGYPFFFMFENTLDPGMTWDIPTVVFYTDDPVTGVSINASLWSVQQELFCYLVVAVMLAVRALDWRPYLLLFALSLPFLVPWSRDNVDVLMALVDWSFEDQRLSEYFWVGSSFFAGGLVYFFSRGQQAFPRWPLGLCALFLLVGLLRRQPFDYFPLYVAYPLLAWATSPTKQLPSLKRVGDMSYGIYLYGWPLEQAVRGWLGPTVSWWQVVLLAGVASVAIGYASWHLIEKPALSLKRFFQRSQPVAAGALRVPESSLSGSSVVPERHR